MLKNLFSYREYHFDFIGKKKIFYIIAILLIVPGLIVTAISGLNAGIEFTGGTRIALTYTNDVDIADVRATASEILSQTPSVNESTEGTFTIRAETLSEDMQKEVIAALGELGELDETQTNITLIGPTIGQELLRNALWALLIASALMLVYITFRFKFNYAFTAVFALLQDVLVIVSVFAIFRLEVDSAFIAAILTTIGYSINNTIIIFDRIRENSNYYAKKEFSVLINDSINQTLTRTINTVLAVLFLLLALMIFGGETTKTFILAIIIGLTSGFFTSVFVVGNLLNDLTRFLNKRKQNQKGKTGSPAKDKA